MTTSNLDSNLQHLTSTKHNSSEHLHYINNTTVHCKMETPPPTADIVAADPSSVKIAAIRAATTGLEFLDSLIALPTGRDSKSQGYTFNRFIKVMSKEGKLPPEFNDQNYGSMKVGEKATLHASIKALTVDIHGKELF